MTTVAQQLVTFDAMDRIIGRERGQLVTMGDAGLGPVFSEVERIIAAGRRELGGGTLPGKPAAVFGRTAVAMSADRRRELLSGTAWGRAVLADDARRHPDRATLSGGSPARRRELLEMSPVGRKLLADEARARSGQP